MPAAAILVVQGGRADAKEALPWELTASRGRPRRALSEQQVAAMPPSHERIFQGDVENRGSFRNRTLEPEERLEAI